MCFADRKLYVCRRECGSIEVVAVNVVEKFCSDHSGCMLGCFDC